MAAAATNACKSCGALKRNEKGSEKGDANVELDARAHAHARRIRKRDRRAGGHPVPLKRLEATGSINDLNDWNFWNVFPYLNL